MNALITIIFVKLLVNKYYCWGEQVNDNTIKKATRKKTGICSTPYCERFGKWTNQNA